MQRTLNLGVLAHVDAGKTTLTEQILFRAGVIDAIGSVDRGTTQTDSLELERQRGITIQSAIVSFRIGELKVNLIDTPGHPDFIAEVERALGVLDAVVLVVSAVEGIQPQTRRLAQAIDAAGIPVIIFTNKIDRRGAREQELLDEIRRVLHLRVVPLNRVRSIGSRASAVEMRSTHDPMHVELLTNVLSEASDDLLDEWLASRGRFDPARLDAELIGQVHRRLITPVVFGSAMMGVGVDQLMDVIERCLPGATGPADGPLSGTVFKIQRTPSGEKVVLARLFSGHLEPRQRITVCHPLADGEAWQNDARITRLDVFHRGGPVPADWAGAGDIVRLHGLKEVRIGDTLGRPPEGRRRITFAPPVFESVVSPVNISLRPQMNAALGELADQDPLIRTVRDPRRGDVSVRLYGEVQKEVVAAILADDYGVEVEFEPSSIVHVEAPIGTGYAVEQMGMPGNPFAATVGLRVGPGPRGSGITFTRGSGRLPLAFYTAIEETVHATLAEGLYGWSVIDVLVTLVDVGFSSVVSTAGDFRRLTPLVLMAALQQAGTSVLEPVERFRLEVPESCLGNVLAAVHAVRGTVDQFELHVARWRVTGTLPTATLHAFEHRLPDISHGEGDLDTRFDAYAPVTGPYPIREHTAFNPLNRKLYLAQVSQS